MTTLTEVLKIAEDVHTDLPAPILCKIENEAKVAASQNIGGFPIVDPLHVEDCIKNAKWQRSLAITEYKESREKAKAHLQKLGIDKYIAIVPTLYWQKLCDCHHLITVHPGLHRGDMSVNTKKVYDITEKARHYWDTAAGIFGGCAGLIALGTFAIQFFGQFFDLHKSLLGSAAVGGLITLSGLSFLIAQYLGKRAVMNHLAKTSYGDLIRELLHYEPYNYLHSHQAKLILPSPPEDVVMLLRKLRDGNQGFSVTAEPEALQFSPSVEELYRNAHALTKERMREMAHDPIITIYFGKATAVLAQFGDFNWEKKVMEEIIGNSALPISSN